MLLYAESMDSILDDGRHVFKGLHRDDPSACMTGVQGRERNGLT